MRWSNTVSSICDEEGHNGAYIASHLFASHFTSLREINSLQDEVAKANELLQNKMLEYKVDTRKKTICGVHVLQQFK